MKALIIADAPAQELFFPDKYDAIIALDGAANWLKGKVKPTAIVGDLDIISKEAQDYFSFRGVEIEKIRDQNSTDMEKGIMFCDQKGYNQIDIINALSGRMDHTIYNLRLLKKYYNPSRPICIFHNQQRHEYFEDCPVEISGTVGDEVAIISMPKAKVSSSGLKYEMNNFAIELGKAESTSNSLASTKARIELSGGVIVICGMKSQL